MADPEYVNIQVFFLSRGMPAVAVFARRRSVGTNHPAVGGLRKLVGTAVGFTRGCRVPRGTAVRVSRSGAASRMSKPPSLFG